MKNPSRFASSQAGSSERDLWTSAQPGWPDQREPVERDAVRHREDQLDNALAESFPASDPIACYRCN
ncbi:hypothetical protein ACFPL7_04855 [Dongia soli]|uniref:Uncharacterized protein n=1 Tax=Dongia soli TaxID=600628 RepID=A0ABU5EED2_9PROT|nr:hypothetical protein [Dongia soli]MDY0884728.1 hypothetical protein [Dongia soli]